MHKFELKVVPQYRPLTGNSYFVVMEMESGEELFDNDCQKETRPYQSKLIAEQPGKYSPTK
jgi:hypothetical protein